MPSITATNIAGANRRGLAVGELVVRDDVIGCHSISLSSCPRFGNSSRRSCSAALRPRSLTPGIQYGTNVQISKEEPQDATSRGPRPVASAPLLASDRTAAAQASARQVARPRDRGEAGTERETGHPAPRRGHAWRHHRLPASASALRERRVQSCRRGFTWATTKPTIGSPCTCANECALDHGRAKLIS